MSGGGRTAAGARRDAVIFHGLWALLSGGALSLLAALPLRAYPRIPCVFRDWTHLPCPFCGLTRAVRSAAAGDWAESFRTAPLGPLLLMGGVAFFIWHAAGALRGRFQPPLLATRGQKRAAWLLALLAASANWAYRLAMGFDR